MVTAYFLELAVCKPGTTEVIERFRMTGMKPGPNQPTQIWGFIRRYMADGPTGVPDIPQRPRDINFRRSLFTYARFVDPSEDGRAWRAKSNVVELTMMLAVSPIILPMVLLAGIGHYISMRFAPEPHFPPDIEAESTSA